MSVISHTQTLESALLEAPARSERIRVVGPGFFPIDWAGVVRACAEAGAPDVDVLFESDNVLFTGAFLTDSPQSQRRQGFQELRFARDELLERCRVAGLAPKITHLPLRIGVVQVGDSLFCGLLLADSGPCVLEVTDDPGLGSAVQNYLSACFSPDLGAKYAATPDAELLELFDHNRIPRGIYPRNCFYDTDYSQSVVWAMIFDRSGRLLIHRRSDNARDNQGMWDKSVGGHVDFALDHDPGAAAVREVVEELFTDETSPSDFHAFDVSDEDVLFLGDWRPAIRGNQVFRELATYDRQWGYVRVREAQHVYTPRTLADGTVRRLRVIADVYLFVAGEVLGDDMLGSLKNSQYKLVDVAELKSTMDLAMSGIAVPGFDDSRELPIFTPDLVNIMTGALRDTLEEFVQFIRQANLK